VLATPDALPSLEELAERDGIHLTSALSPGRRLDTAAPSMPT
jgi:hypothetical protein